MSLTSVLTFKSLQMEMNFLYQFLYGKFNLLRNIIGMWIKERKAPLKSFEVPLLKNQ